MMLTRCLVLVIVGIILVSISLTFSKKTVSINPMWLLDYYECTKVKKLATRELPELRSWVDFARENYALDEISSPDWSDERIEWFKSTQRTYDWLENNTPTVVLLNIDSKKTAKTWNDVDLIGLSHGPYHHAYVRYNSKTDISKYSQDHRYQVINQGSAVYCGSRFLDGD